MIKPDIKIIAVDNDTEELDRIVKTFNRLRISCFPIEYNIGDGIEEKFPDIRIAFFDINLGALGNPSDADLCNIITSALKEIIDVENGPYALIFWSRHANKVDIIKEYIEEREKGNIPSPLIIDKIDKALIVDEDAFLKEVKRILSNSTLVAMFDYQEKAKKAASKTINSIFSLIPRNGDKWGEYNNFEDNFDLVFSKMAINTLGEELARRNPDLAVQKALFPLLLDNIQKESLSSVWKKKMHSLSYKSDVKFPKDFDVEALNTIYHLDDNCSYMKKIDRGIVVEIKQTSAKFKKMFGKGKRDLIESFFTYPKSKGKSAKEIETERQDFINSCTPIFVEISAGCDYAQQNPRSLKYLFGIKFPLKPLVAKPSNGNYKFITPSFSLNGDKFSMVFSFRYIYGYQGSNRILGNILFKFNNDLINQIGNRYANHVSRIGIIDYE